MAHRPVTDLVAQAWLASLPGFTAGMVGARLPQDTTGWETTGFVQVFTVGGTVENYTGVRHPRVQVNCWAVKPAGASPPWGRANALAETVIDGAVNGTGQQTTLALGAYHDPARVLSVTVASEPRRLPGDQGAYACYTFDMVINWVVT